MKRDTYEDWEERFDAWLASLPADSQVHALSEIEQCVAFSDYEEALAGLEDFKRNGGVTLDELQSMLETKH
jgi:hypothetical protein